ncbi:DUF1697 domain-containing protein [Paludisphaera mucosa]|uniref:DUF1697 domain-containing protein n=1 Tax=Paludisphaera mucosa TaxID=3030827 RepID=A0ABT6FKP4_9BACT|nr:DUF1697 domain-containing protein [Paludisphaera mucosa]MDG3008148.1 DUF1697 domain-containing protein [Paludisphaera mucosa]
MAVFIALYRGLNVGGKTTVKMESLRAVHERLGHRGVKNYIQSGNVVFATDDPVEDLAKACAVEFARAFGFASRVMLVEAERWSEILAGNPYAGPAAEDPKSVHVGICLGAPDAGRLAALLAKTKGREAFEVRGDVVYLHAPDGVGRSKFAEGMEKAAGVPMTMRNWRTMEALQALADEAAE